MLRNISHRANRRPGKPPGPIDAGFAEMPEGGVLFRALRHRHFHFGRVRKIRSRQRYGSRLCGAGVNAMQPHWRGFSRKTRRRPSLGLTRRHNLLAGDLSGRRGHALLAGAKRASQALDETPIHARELRGAVRRQCCGVAQQP